MAISAVNSLASLYQPQLKAQTKAASTKATASVTVNISSVARLRLAAATATPQVYTAADAVSAYQAALANDTLASLAPLTIQDTATNVQANLADLSLMAKAQKVASLKLTSAKPVLTIDRTSATGDLAAIDSTNGTALLLQKIGSAFTLSVENIAVSDALSFKTPSKLASLSFKIKDQGSAVFGALTNLSKLRQIGEIQITNPTDAMTISAAQYASSATVLNAIKSAYSLKISDVDAKAFTGVIKNTNVKSLTVKDSAANIIAAQATLLQPANLAKITGATLTDTKLLQLSIKDATTLASLPSVKIPKLGYSISDTAANIAARIRFDDKNIIGGAEKLITTDKTPPNLSVSDAKVLLGSKKLTLPLNYNIVDTADAIASQAANDSAKVLSGAKLVTAAHVLNLKDYGTALKLKTLDPATRVIIEDTAQNIIADAKKKAASILGKAAAVSVADTGASISAQMTDLQTYVKSGQIHRLRLTDTAQTSAISLESSQFSAAADVIGRMRSPVWLDVKPMSDDAITRLSPIMSPVLEMGDRHYFSASGAGYSGDQIWAVSSADANTFTLGGLNKVHLEISPQDRVDAQISGSSVDLGDSFTRFTKSPSRAMIFTRSGTNPYVNGAAVWVDLGSETGTTYSVKFQKLEFTPFSFKDTSTGRQPGEIRLSGQTTSLINDLDISDDFTTLSYSTGFALSWSTPASSTGKKDYKLAFFDTNGTMIGNVQTAVTVDKSIPVNSNIDPDGNVEVFYNEGSNVKSLKFSPTTVSTAHYPSSMVMTTEFDAGSVRSVSASYVNQQSGVWKNEVIATTGTVDGRAQIKFVAYDATTQQLIGSQTLSFMSKDPPSKINYYRMSDGLNTLFVYQEGSALHMTIVNEKGAVISDQTQPIPNSQLFDGAVQFAQMRSFQDGRLEVVWRERAGSPGANVYRYQIFDTRSAAATSSGSNSYPALLGGTKGDDTLTLNSAMSVVEGGPGADKLTSTVQASSTATQNPFVSYAHSRAGVTADLLANTFSGGDAQGDTVNGFYNIIGSNFDDTLSGNASSNIFIGGGGNDTITGNGGVDEVWYNGDAEDYAISAQQDGSFIVKDLRATRPDGIDTLRDINALSFWNRRVTLT